MAFKELPIQKMKISSQCLHAGVRPEPVTGAIMTPIFQTSTYVQESPGKHKGYDYSRTKNPTRSALEEAIAVLEGGGSGLAFSSGVAATTTILHLLNSGDHVVAFDDMYGGTYRLFKTFEPMGISFSFIDLRDSASFEKAVTSKTKLLWIETPTNPTMKIADIAALSKTAQKKGIITCVDNTFMTPYFQRPLDLGADIVAHSATKYVNGHSDVVAGLAVTRRKELWSASTSCKTRWEQSLRPWIVFSCSVG
jgi:cystathionine gamma-lyase